MDKNKSIKNIMSKIKKKLTKITSTNRNKVSLNKENIDKDNQKTAVCALIYDVDYRLLSVSRKDDISDYGFAGGKIEEGEFLVDGLIREVKEETGLDIVKHTLLWERMDKDFKVYTFLCKCTGKVTTRESGIVRWLNQDEISLLINGSFGNYNKNLLEYIIDNPNKYDYEDYVSIEIRG